MNELVKGVLDVLETINVRGGGLSEITGPIRFNKFVQFGPYVTDPVVTLWGAAEAGRIWYNITSNVFKYWDGSAIQVFAKV